MTDITLTLPAHAVHLIARMCKEKRHQLAVTLAVDATYYSPQHEAAYDSLNEIESVIPQDIWDQVKREES